MAGPPSQSLVYSTFVRNGVIALTAGGFLSVLAILCLALMFATSHRSLKFAQTGTHLLMYFICLLVSDTLQATGAIMNLNWVTLGGVSEGTFCMVQGAVKQAGNVSAAIWSFTIAVHIFNLLFLRYETSRIASWGILGFGWSFTAIMVLLGPAAIQTEAKGPFFGISGEWCWITKEYRAEQVLLQYLFEAISVVLSLVLYALTLMRVRGNLIKVNGRWTLRFLSKEDSWKLDLNRDYTDLAGMGLVKHMIWYPVAYMILVLPVALVRLSAFAGAKAPFGATVFAGFIFDLCGFVDVVLFVTLDRIFPERGSQPAFTARRKTVDLGIMETGVTPFTLDKPVDPDARSVRSMATTMSDDAEKRLSLTSINSTTPLNL
ncbi:hypothetical protein C8F01DRAFT_489397 [Mycena amicta]|nr:hypothetical protein C8F01DRAFT_489397 [Mycena amicta]